MAGYNNPNDIKLTSDGLRGAVRSFKDKCTGHGIYPGRGAIEGSKSVMINGKSANRIGDTWKRHYGIVLLNEGDTPDPYYPAPYGPDGGATPYYNGDGVNPVTDDDIEYLGPPLNPGDPGYPKDLPPDPGPPPPEPTKPEPLEPGATPEQQEAYQEEMKAYNEAMKEYKDSEAYKSWKEAADKGPPYDGDTIYPPMKEYPDVSDSHDSVSVSGSANVLINGLPLCRVGDEIECGSRIKFGSANVLVNGPISSASDAEGLGFDSGDIPGISENNKVDQNYVDDLVDEFKYKEFGISDPPPDEGTN